MNNPDTVAANATNENNTANAANADNTFSKIKVVDVKSFYISVHVHQEAPNDYGMNVAGMMYKHLVESEFIEDGKELIVITYKLNNNVPYIVIINNTETLTLSEKLNDSVILIDSAERSICCGVIRDKDSDSYGYSDINVDKNMENMRNVIMETLEINGNVDVYCMSKK